MPPSVVNVGDVPHFTGYRQDLENHAEIIQRGMPAYAQWKKSFDEYDWEPPKELDPREWFDVHNQGSVGSCQGQSLADGAEFSHIIAYGKEIQISRGFAYLSTQEFDNLLGRDSGSTLSGGSKAAKRGLPYEEKFPYVANYNQLLRSYRQQKSSLLSDDANLFKLKSAIPIQGSEDAYRFLSSWSGAIHIGITWTLRNQWEHTSYSTRGGGGGHAVLIPGYLHVSSWPMGIGFLLKNSWSQNWGRNGWALIHPRAFDSMMRAQWGVGIGRSDMSAPRPRVESSDFARSSF